MARELLRVARLACCLALGLSLVLQGMQAAADRSQGLQHMHVELPAELVAAVARIVADPSPAHPHLHLPAAHGQLQRHWHAGAEQQGVRVRAEADDSATPGGIGVPLCMPRSNHLTPADACVVARMAAWPAGQFSVATRHVVPPERPPRNLRTA